MCGVFFYELVGRKWRQIQIQIQYVLFIKVQSGMYHLRPRTDIHKLTIWGIWGTTRNSI